MSIQRYDWDFRGMDEYAQGKFVTHSDHLTDKQAALDAQQATHAAEVERLTREMGALSQKLKLTEEELDDVQGKLDDADEFSSGCIALILRHVGEAELEEDDLVSITDLEQAIMRYESDRDAAVRERDAAVEALRPFAGLDMSPYEGARDERTFYQLNETEITVGDIRKARAVLAKIEGGRG